MSKIVPIEPKFEYAMTITINLQSSHFVRPSLYGSERWMVYLKDGTVEGPEINGIVMPGSGGDFPMWRPDGVIDFDARYVLQTDDGVLIYVQNRGYRWAPKDVMDAMSRREDVKHSDYYMRVAPKFEAPAGKYEWLSKYVFVGVAEKTPAGNQIHYYKLL
jgi:hypothetical protein